ncbi:hypothetical protein CRI70_10825 [Streptomyces sp. Ru87]|nr:hypothetical protein CRI70_10825 [Streptomyces sp. Ru87]
MLLASAVGLAVLYGLAGLSSRVFVRVGSVAWPTPERWTAGTLGFLLTGGAATMLPLYAMFKPFAPGEPLLAWACAALLLCGPGAVVLVVLASVREPGRDWRHWVALLLSLAAAVVAGLVLLIAPPAPEQGLLVVYAALTWIGVVLTAATLGQNLRLQVEVQQPDGTVSAGSTDYLLARMKTLGMESPKALNRATSAIATTPISKITNEDLSALPAGKVAGAVSRLLFALRADLTWRARVTFVDDERVAMTLSRNGRHAESSVFSRPDLGLPGIAPGPDDAARSTARDRARAQMLTGAAAFILLRLGEAHVDLRADLCGARRWQSVALQVIATSKSLVEETEQGGERVRLLSRAMDLDPDYVLARFEYMWAANERADRRETDYAKFAEALDRQYVQSGLAGKGDAEEGWAPLRIRVMYSSTVHWLNGYLRTGERDHRALLEAARSAAELNRLCRLPWKRPQLAQQAEYTRPFAENLLHCVEVLSGVTPQTGAGWLHPHQRPGQPPAAPRLTYDHACLDCFLAELPGQDRAMRLGQAVEDLEFAVATDRDRTGAAADPCFSPLHSGDRFRRLVAGLTPDRFLDLPVFAGHKSLLARAGITSASDLAHRTENAERQQELAEHLRVSRAFVQRLRDVALLAQLHPDLAEPHMLHLLIAEDIASPEALRDRAGRDPAELVRRLRDRADENGLDRPAALGWPRRGRWLRTARRPAASPSGLRRRRVS